MVGKGAEVRRGPYSNGTTALDDSCWPGLVNTPTSWLAGGKVGV